MDQPLDLRVKRSQPDDRRVSNIMGNPYSMAMFSTFWTHRIIPQHPWIGGYWPHYQPCCLPPMPPKHLQYEQVLSLEHKLEETSVNVPFIRKEHLGNNFDNDDQMPNTLNRKRPAPEPTRPLKSMGARYSVDFRLSEACPVGADNSFKYETGTCKTTKRTSSSDSYHSCESFDHSYDMPNSFRDTVTQCPNITIIIDEKCMNDFKFRDAHEYDLYVMAKKNPELIVKMMQPDDAEAYMKFKQQYGDMAPRTKTNLNMRRKVPTKSAHSNDPDYTIKRLKNNESAKRSRDNRIAMSYELDLLDMFLKQKIEEKFRRLPTNPIQPIIG